MRTEKKNSISFILLSIVGFIIFWIVLTDAWGTSKLIFSNTIVLGEYIYGYIVRVIWVMPAFFLIVRAKEKTLAIPCKTLLSKPRINASLRITLFIIVIYCLIGMYVKHGGLHLNTDYFILLIIKALLVGVVEETVFRGWGYNALCTVTTQIKAMLLSSLLFAAIHCPAYIIRYIMYGNFDSFVMLQQLVLAFAFGILFCVLLNKGKSLWNPIIAHSFYDAFAFLLF